MKNKQWMLRAVGVISALALGLGGLAACGNSSSAESKNGRVYYLNKKAEEQSTWVKLGKAFEKETGIPVQIQTGGTDYDATLRSELSKKAAPTMFQADGPSFMSSFKKYAKDLSNSDIYKQLDKNYKNRVLTNDEGKPIAIPYATESYGIIYNKALLKKYLQQGFAQEVFRRQLVNGEVRRRYQQLQGVEDRRGRDSSAQGRNWCQGSVQLRRSRLQLGFPL